MEKNNQEKARVVHQVTPIPAATPRRERVAAYCRVSSGKDAMLHSLSAQVSHYSTYIQKHPGWEYAGVYADEAYTGTKDTRPQFQCLLEECRAKRIDRILTKSVSRFARNTVTLLETVRELRSLGVAVYFEEQNIDSLSEDGELMLTILASFAQAESKSVSDNCKWRIRKDFSEGKPVNLSLIHGYRQENGRIEIDPEEAAVVRRVFSEYLQGKGTLQIANLLQQEGIPRRFGGQWCASSVREMLINEKYWNVATNSWEVEGGMYQLHIAASAEDIRLTGELPVAGTGATNPYEGKLLCCYERCELDDVPDAEFAALLGHPIPPHLWDTTAPLGMNDTVMQLCYAQNPLARLVWRILRKKKEDSIAAGKPDLNLLFIYNIPFRGIAKMMNGMVSMKMAESILTMVNGHFFWGLGGVIAGFVKRPALPKGDE